VFAVKEDLRDGIACLEPGHFEGGMQGVVDVAPNT
jgi:uncharacterized cupredoxin-like copper-binding protein